MRRRFNRNSGYKKPRKKYIISVEGQQTEMQYFRMFKDAGLNIDPICNKNQANPTNVLKTLKTHLKRNEIKLNSKAEAWVVVDKEDSNNISTQQLNSVSVECIKENYNLAVSNPCIELWILFHFYDKHKFSAKDIDTNTKCKAKLKQIYPNYAKNNVESKILLEKTNIAISRAKELDATRDGIWPEKTGTTIYKLVEKLICELKS